MFFKNNEVTKKAMNAKITLLDSLIKSNYPNVAQFDMRFIQIKEENGIQKYIASYQEAPGDYNFSNLCRILESLGASIEFRDNPMTMSVRVMLVVTMTSKCVDQAIKSLQKAPINIESPASR